MLFKKNAMKIFSKITGKHLQWSPFFIKYFVCNFSKRILDCRYFFCEFCKFFQNKNICFLRYNCSEKIWKTRVLWKLFHFSFFLYYFFFYYYAFLENFSCFKNGFISKFKFDVHHYWKFSLFTESCLQKLNQQRNKLYPSLWKFYHVFGFYRCKAVFTT